MANQLLTTDMIADRALMRFSEACSFLKTIPKTYASEFKEGAPAIGDTLRVAIPQHAQIVSGRVANPAPMQTLIGQVKVIDQLNFSINQQPEHAGQLRHVGFEDDDAHGFTCEADVNGIAWENFSALAQELRIISTYGVPAHEPVAEELIRN